MKLVRHFLAVSVGVAIVVALGFVWSWSGAAGIVADDRGDSLPSGASSIGVRELKRGAGGFSLSNISDLAQTLVILTLITVAVVIIDKVRRRYGPRRFPVRGAAQD
ncbi:MAG: hypothetical protein JWM34_1767 [Ilumatobacteraceae bacterium]|nr:hypothetical protein [Ilumatobacteraceae bacterium]